VLKYPSVFLEISVFENTYVGRQLSPSPYTFFYSRAFLWKMLGTRYGPVGSPISLILGTWFIWF